MQTKSILLDDIELLEKSYPEQYEMSEQGLKSDSSDSINSDMEDENYEIYRLGEDQLPEPSDVEKNGTIIEKSSYSTLKIHAPEITKLIFSQKESHKIITLSLSSAVKILKQNHGGKLLRIRVIPALKDIKPALLEDIQEKFEKFSIHQTNKYSEIVMAAKGRIGIPYISSDTEVFSLSIPFQYEQTRFALTTGEKVSEGVRYYRDRTKVGNRYTDAHILRIEPFVDAIRVCPVLANEGIAQKETLSSMANRYKAIAGINGAYFTPRGDPIGTLIINRRLISSPLYKRSVFGVNDDDSLIFGNPDFSGVLRSGKLSISIDAVNQPRKGDKLVVFTPEYARSTITNNAGVELVLVKGKIVGIHSYDTLIPPDGVVVSASGAKATQLKQLRLGQSVELDYSIEQPWNNIKHAVCGGPRLLSDGRNDINGKEEKFSSSIVYGRHPRTAIGLTFDGDLVMIVIDGRSKRNSGMKLKELADYLKSLGVRHAINLDGGGSSSMIINGKTVNNPSDGKGRRISNGILITKRQ